MGSGSSIGFFSPFAFVLLTPPCIPPASLILSILIYSYQQNDHCNTTQPTAVQSLYLCSCTQLHFFFVSVLCPFSTLGFFHLPTYLQCFLHPTSKHCSWHYNHFKNQKSCNFNTSWICWLNHFENYYKYKRRSSSLYLSFLLLFVKKTSVHVSEGRVRRSLAQHLSWDVASGENNALSFVTPCVLPSHPYTSACDQN